MRRALLALADAIGRRSYTSIAAFTLLACAAAFTTAAGQESRKTAPGGAETHAVSPEPPGAVTPGHPVQVDGFRSARWGMTEAEVKAAIKKDFGTHTDKVRGEHNQAQRTSALAVTVNNLIEGAGPAQVDYVFGYKTKRLIQVNIEWGTPVDARVDAESVVAAANELRDYLIGAGYDPKTVATNLRLPDGGIIVFRGQDGQRHTTLLRLVELPAKPDRKGAAAKEPQVALFLSYALDAESPDIFRLKKGEF